MYLSICTDCALWWANRDDSGSIRSGAEIESMFRAEWDGWRDVTTGRWPEPVVTGDETHFSHSACDSCGEALAGDRIDAVLMED